MNLKTLGLRFASRPEYAGEILKRSFISTVTLTTHTNLVSFAAVVTQRFSPLSGGEALRDDSNNGGDQH